MSEFSKMPEQIMDRKVLETLIEETQGLFENICVNPHKFEPWHKQVVGHNLKALRLINQRLGYE